VVKFEAFKFVKADPFKAGKVAGKLALGIVPETLVALMFVKAEPSQAGSVPDAAK